MKLLLRAALAVAFSLALAPAMAGERVTADQLEQKLMTATLPSAPDFHLTQIKIKPETFKAFMDGLAATGVGYPPNKDTLVSAIVFKPDDLKKFNVYVAFFDAGGCKQTGIMMPSQKMVQMLQGVSGPPLHLPADGQRDA